MSSYKTAAINFQISASSSDIRTNATFFSQDYGLGKFQFKLTNNTLPLDLTGATAILTIVTADQSTFQYTCDIGKDPTQGIAEIVLDKDVLQHIGTATAELTIVFSDSQSLSAGQFKFVIAQSLSDQSSGAIQYYIQSIENLKVQYQQEWESWFNTIRGQLGSDPAGNLQNQINDVTAQLATKLKLGHSDYNGETANDPMIEIGVIGAGAALHLLAGESMTAPYVVGIGVDHDGKTGQTISVKANNNVGLGIDLTNTSGADSVGLLGQAIGLGTVLKLVQGSGANGSLIDLRNDYGGTGNMLSWSSANQGYFGKIGYDGTITRTSGVSGEDHQLISSVGSAHNESHYHYTGTTGLWFYTGLVTYANNMIIQQAPPAAIGSEVPTRLLHFRDGNKIGFFGVEPAPQIQPIPNAENADIVDLQNKFNLLLQGLRNLGLVAL